MNSFLDKYCGVMVVNTIKRMDFIEQFILLLDYFCGNNTMWPFHHLAPAVWPFLYPYNLTGQFFQPSQFNQNFCLLSFDVKIWKQYRDTIKCLLICYCPRIKWFAFLCGWLLNAVVAAKTFVKKIRDIFCNLFQSYLLRVNRMPGIFSNSHVIGRAFDSKIAIRIKATCQVSLRNLIHAYSIAYSVVGGNYL